MNDTIFFRLDVVISEIFLTFFNLLFPVIHVIYSYIWLVLSIIDDCFYFILVRILEYVYICIIPSKRVV